MEAAANQGSAALPHVNPTAPLWTVEGLRSALRALDSGLPGTIRTGLRYLRNAGLSREEATERAYGSAPRRIFTAAEVTALAAEYDCLHVAPVTDDPASPGLTCREFAPHDPDEWCPTCMAREAVGQ